MHRVSPHPIRHAPALPDTHLTDVLYPDLWRQRCPELDAYRPPLESVTRNGMPQEHPPCVEHPSPQLTHQLIRQRARTHYRQPETRDLEAWLLSHGGRGVYYEDQELPVTLLLTRGERWIPKQILHVPGEPGHCHRNTVLLWATTTHAGHPFTLMTGYALSEDGIWREHSWGRIASSLIETTIPRLRYCGLAWCSHEALARWHIYAPGTTF